MISKDEFLKICEKYNLVGANLYIVDGNNEVSYQMGLMDKENEVATKKNTIYRIASISKTVLAIGAMHLVENGKLDLDEDISTYLGFKIRNPYFPNCKITTRMLMTQTSSITDGFDDEDMTNETRIDGYNGLNGRHLDIPLKTVLVPNDSPYYSDLTFDKAMPGTHFIYSNFGCGILACLIEKASGMNYDQYMKKYVFDPLKLDASYYAYNIKHQDDIACLYYADRVIKTHDWAKRAYKQAPLGESYLGPAGGLFISMPDLAKIMKSFYRPELAVLKPNTLQQMFEVNWEGDAGDYKKKGLQMIIIDDLVPFRLYGHFGSAYGLRSFMLFNPEKQIGACFVTNGGRLNEYTNHIPSIHYDLIKLLWGE